LDKQLSTGVSETDTKDPLWKLLLTKNDEDFSYLRKLLHSDGMVTTRIEFSFYGDLLKATSYYNEIMGKLFIGG